MKECIFEGLGQTLLPEDIRSVCLESRLKKALCGEVRMWIMNHVIEEIVNAMSSGLLSAVVYVEKFPCTDDKNNRAFAHKVMRILKRQGFSVSTGRTDDRPYSLRWIEVSWNK